MPAAPAVAAEDAEVAEEGSIFLRVRRNEAGDPISMETSIVTYTLTDEDGEELEIDLIGAVHIGDEAYYDELNEQFPVYEALLFELVTPGEGEVEVPAGRRSNHPVAGIQGIMQSMLELSHQLHIIDYTAENFVHADMSIQEFNEKMAERGESWLQMYFQAMGQSMAQQSGGGPSDLDLLRALFSDDRPLLLKRLMAEQFEGLDGAMDIFSDEEGSTIITERNSKALEVLDEQIEAGVHHIGIFYGAGHMDDFQRRLIEDYGLERGEIRWVVAWDLTGNGTARVAVEDAVEEAGDSEEAAEEAEPADEQNEPVPAGA